MNAPNPVDPSVLVISIGIQRYEYGPGMDLAGATDAAQRFARWALACKVHPTNVWLACSPPPPAESWPPDVKIVDATQHALEDMFVEASWVKANLLLFYWCGHGVLNTNRQRALFTSDATEHLRRHLIVDDVLEYLSSATVTHLHRQMLFIDACANFVERMTPMPLLGRPGNLQGGPPREVPQAVLYSAAQGQYADATKSTRTITFSEVLLPWLEKWLKKQLKEQPEEQPVALPPDFGALVKHVKAKFEKLRQDKKVRQHPVTLTKRDFEGNVQLLYDEVPVAAAPVEPIADLVERPGAGDDLPIVADLDPYLLGAKPSPFGGKDSYGQRDPYVPRTHNGVDTTLAGELDQSHQMVLLIGPSKAGKTRTAFEAVKAHLPQAHLLAPLPGTFARLATHPRLCTTSDTIVVWLDDLNRYLMCADPLTPALLRRLRRRPGPTVVLATLQQKERDRLHQPDVLTDDTLRLLNEAFTICLASTSGHPDEEAAAAKAYPGQDLTFGLAAQLAGAPEVRRQYDDARDTDPLLHAVIQVAVDWARVGRPDHIPEKTLARLARYAFQSERPDLDATDTQVRKAIKVARTAAPEGAGRVAALITRGPPDFAREYRPFDYLVATDDGQDHTPRPIPDPFWDQALEDAGPTTAYAVGLSAFTRDNLLAAIRAFRKTADAGDTGAMTVVGALLSRNLKPPQLSDAEYWLQRAADAGHPRAMHYLGVLLSRQKRPPELSKAKPWLERAAIHDYDRLRFPEEADGTCDIAAMVAFGYLLSQQLDPPHLLEAREWFRRAIEFGTPEALYDLGYLLSEQVDRPDLPSAIRAFRKAADAGDTGAMCMLGLLMSDRLDRPKLSGARHWYEKAADAGHTDAMKNLRALDKTLGQSDGAAET